MSTTAWYARVLLAVAVAVAVGVLPVAGCTKNPADTHAKNAAMNQFPDIPSDFTKQLAFTCAYEKDRIPPRDPEADQLYKHARWLSKANTLRQVAEAYPPIERLLRIATAHGHDRANVELRHMLDKGRAQSDDPVNETIDMVQDLIKRGIPAGYCGMGRYLKNGYGVEQDQELAFKYYRKAADLGNPEGQYFVGDLLNDFSKHGREIASIGLAMQRCAA
jgi:TPR repeat protein